MFLGSRAPHFWRIPRSTGLLYLEALGGGARCFNESGLLRQGDAPAAFTRLLSHGHTQPEEQHFLCPGRPNLSSLRRGIFQIVVHISLGK